MQGSQKCVCSNSSLCSGGVLGRKNRIIASSKLGVGCKTHCRYYSFAVRAKSDRKRALLLAASHRRTQPFFVSTRHILMFGDLCRTERTGSAAFSSVACSVLPHAFALPAIVAELSWCATSTASTAAASTATTTMHSPTHRRLKQALRHENDAQPDHFSHGQRGRDVRYAHTIINAHHVS